jgi:cell division GTPase FtsZ
VEDKVVKLCPDEAAKDALSSQSKVSISDAKFITINFLGGDDLIYGEVKQACDFLVEQLDIPDKAKIKFNSISYTDFEKGTCAVTVVASGSQSSGSDGFEESIAKGEVYIYNGKWFTVTKDDITTSIE